jgi:serine phosphatase RsbU (regulator of sigma subunit)
MCIDHENDLFVGATEGLIYYEIDNNKIDFLTQTSGLAGNDITALYTANDGTVWIGSRNKGLTIIKGADIKIVNPDFNFTPTCFTEDKEGNLWVGTEGLGVLIISDNKIIRKIAAAEGLESGIVTALITDEDGNIYIGTPNGLLKYDIIEKRLLTYGAAEGFVGIEVRPNAAFRNKEGKLWIGTVAGITQVNPKALRINRQAPIVNITRVRVELKDRSIYEPLSLKYTENSVLIDYKGICITNAAKVRYKVMLQGADHDWQPITDQTFSNYPSLPPGDYTFKVLARNNSGIWTKEPATFHFVISPPFWQTAWFYSIVIVLFLIGFVFFIKIRERNLKREKAELEAKVAERTLEIREKNKLLAKKNKDITDSINYARRIQAAMMPSEEKMKSLLPNGFVYYRPKDIVSGDFYWSVKESDRTLVAAADCTGHGVPGAFMSMISISALNKIVKENKVLDPAEILNTLRKDIIEDLTQEKDDGSDTKDGLDIALLSIDYKNMIVDYSGAYNSLYIVKNREITEDEINIDFKFKLYQNRLIEVKADRMPIGISERMHQKFSSRRVKVEAGDFLFITTDGYIDQFGGPKGGKLMSRRFKEILLEIANNNLKEAYKLLNDKFLEWRGDYEQIDDVLVIGIRF